MSIKSALGGALSSSLEYIALYEHCIGLAFSSMRPPSPRLKSFSLARRAMLTNWAMKSYAAP